MKVNLTILLWLVVLIGTSGGVSAVAVSSSNTAALSPTVNAFVATSNRVILPPYKSFVSANVTRALPITNELYRVRIDNTVSGSITVSRDQGKTWETIGMVVFPNLGFVNQIQDGQFTASDWAPVGSVAATAVNALHIKVDNIETHPKLFSILPKELVDGSLVAGSYRSETSSIITDIDGGARLFGNTNGVRVGDPIFLVTGNNELIPWPESKAPLLGDSIVIITQSTRCDDWTLEFENKVGGRVLFYNDSPTPTVVAIVEKPVSGSGRFLGGRFQNEGRVRANHPGVIDIKTSPKGELGGFQIVPHYHSQAPNLAYVKSTPAYMIVKSIDDTPLEGTFPLYKQLIRPGDIVEAKINGEWQKMPESVGLNPTGLTQLEAFRIRQKQSQYPFLKLSK